MYENYLELQQAKRRIKELEEALFVARHLINIKNRIIEIKEQQIIDLKKK